MKKCDECGSCTGNCPGARDPVAIAITGVRHSLKVSQMKFASMLGIKQPTVAQLESGKRKPSPRLAYRLSKLSGKPIENFVEEYYGKQAG